MVRPADVLGLAALAVAFASATNAQVPAAEAGDVVSAYPRYTVGGGAFEFPSAVILTDGLADPAPPGADGPVHRGLVLETAAGS